MDDIEKKKILMLPKYCSSGPSSRYRFYQFKPLLENVGFIVKIQPLFNQSFLKSYYNSGVKNLLAGLKGYISRFILLFSIRKYDLIIIEYELFPYLPPFFEIILRKSGVHYIVDYDDGIYLKYKNLYPVFNIFLKNKIETVIYNANFIFTGNRELFNYASKFNNRVQILTTTVSSKKYDSNNSEKITNDFIVGWIGSPSTSKYLINLIDVFKNITKYESIKIHLIGFDKKFKKLFELKNINIIDWHEETEIQNIKQFNVGIMPLDNDQWSRCKSGFKIIQYMACKIPVIASPVGINGELVEHGANGFLATTLEDWLEAILTLYKNPEKAKGMGLNGYKKFCKYYSFESISNKYLSLINSNLK